MKLKKQVSLSIIIPTYNDTEEKIRRSLDSIVSQEGYDLSTTEIIVVDDGSNKSKIRWQEIIEFYSSLRVVYKKCLANRGAGVARQIALDIANGKYVFFLDCGDCLVNDVVLETFSKYSEGSNDIVVTNINDELFGYKKRNFLSGNAYIFGIFIKRSFLNENSIVFSDVLRWEEDAYYEQLLRFYSPRIVSANIIGYTYSYDTDSVTRRNDYEYQISFGGFCAMVVKSILLCNYYRLHDATYNITEELTKILTLCYRKFYDDVILKRRISDAQKNVLFLLRILLEKFEKMVDQQEARLLFSKIMSKTNKLRWYQGIMMIPDEKIDDFLEIISNAESPDVRRLIKGTNVSIEKLLAIIN